MNKFPHHATVPHTARQVRIAGHNVLGMWHLHKKWCVENIGYKGEQWTYKNGGHFYFADEKDMMLFLLRWL